MSPTQNFTFLCGIWHIGVKNICFLVPQFYKRTFVWFKILGVGKFHFSKKNTFEYSLFFAKFFPDVHSFYLLAFLVLQKHLTKVNPIEKLFPARTLVFCLVDHENMPFCASSVRRNLLDFWGKNLHILREDFSSFGTKRGLECFKKVCEMKQWNSGYTLFYTFLVSKNVLFVTSNMQIFSRLLCQFDWLLKNLIFCARVLSNLGSSSGLVWENLNASNPLGSAFWVCGGVFLGLMKLLVFGVLFLWIEKGWSLKMVWDHFNAGFCVLKLAFNSHRIFLP